MPVCVVYETRKGDGAGGVLEHSPAHRSNPRASTSASRWLSVRSAVSPANRSPGRRRPSEASSLTSARISGSCTTCFSATASRFARALSRTAVACSWKLPNSAGDSIAWRPPTSTQPPVLAHCLTFSETVQNCNEQPTHQIYPYAIHGIVNNTVAYQDTATVTQPARSRRNETSRTRTRRSRPFGNRWTTQPQVP